MTDLVYSRELAKKLERARSLQLRIEMVSAFFPELPEIRFGRASRSAYYDPRSGTVRLTGSSSTYVIGHEITHLLQDGRYLPAGLSPYPKGELSCDVFLFARSPYLVADFWEARDTSYLGRRLRVADLRAHFTRAGGQQLIHEACAEAVRLRAAGKRGYIRWAEEEINDRVSAVLRAVQPGRASVPP